MFTKWIIKGIKGFSFSEDGKLYKDPYEDSMGRFRDWRELKQQRSNWKLNGEWWSKIQLKPKLIIDPNPREIFKTKDLPF